MSMLLSFNSGSVTKASDNVNATRFARKKCSLFLDWIFPKMRFVWGHLSMIQKA